MIMADVFKILFLILGSCIVTVSYWLLFEALAPTIVQCSRDRYISAPFRHFLLGAIFSGPALLVGIGLLQQGPAPAKIFGFLVLFVLSLLALAGSTGLARLVGQRLNSLGDDMQPWRRVLRGGSVLAIACVMPFVGWFAVLPIILVSGVGVATSSIWSIYRHHESPHAPAGTEGVAA